MPASKQSLHHIGLRYLALASKPALLWLLVVTGSSAAAVEVGALILVASLIGMAMSNEAHLQFYAAIFSTRQPPRSRLFQHLVDYLRALATHIILITGPVLVVCMVFFPTVNPLLAIMLSFAERVSDEILRFRLYCKEWGTWITLLIAKSAVPGLTAISAIFVSRDLVGWGYAVASLVFTLGLLIWAGRAVHRALKRALQKLVDRKYVLSYIKHYGRVLSLRQTAAILGVTVVLLDRYVGMSIWQQAETAYILLAGQIVNGVYFAAEAKFLAENRANFVNQDLKMQNFWSWRHYLLLLTLCFFGCGAIFTVATMLNLLPEAGPDIYLSVLFMVINYAVFYASVPLNDYVYYRGGYRGLALGHALLFAVFASVIVGVDALHSPPITLAILVAMLMLRMLWLFRAKRALDRAMV
jgi:hypothetical protein